MLNSAKVKRIQVRKHSAKNVVPKPIWIRARSTPVLSTMVFAPQFLVTPVPDLTIPLNADATQNVYSQFSLRFTRGLGVVGRNGSINIQTVAQRSVKRNHPRPIFFQVPTI